MPRNLLTLNQSQPRNLLRSNQTQPRNLLAEQTKPRNLLNPATNVEQPDTFMGKVINFFAPSIKPAVEFAKTGRKATTADMAKVVKPTVEQNIKAYDIPFQAVHGFVGGKLFNIDHILTADWTPTYKGKEALKRAIAPKSAAGDVTYRLFNLYGMIRALPTIMGLKGFKAFSKWQPTRGVSVLAKRVLKGGLVLGAYSVLSEQGGEDLKDNLKRRGLSGASGFAMGAFFSSVHSISGDLVQKGAKVFKLEIPNTYAQLSAFIMRLGLNEMVTGAPAIKQYLAGKDHLPGAIYNVGLGIAFSMSGNPLYLERDFNKALKKRYKLQRMSIPEISKNIEALGEFKKVPADLKWAYIMKATGGNVKPSAKNAPATDGIFEQTLRLNSPETYNKLDFVRNVADDVGAIMNRYAEIQPKAPPIKQTPKPPAKLETETEQVEPIVETKGKNVYHWSPTKNIEKFTVRKVKNDLGVHFGTEQAAKDRAKGKEGKTYSVNIDPGKSLTMPDVLGWDNPRNVLDGLMSTDAFSKQELDLLEASIPDSHAPRYKTKAKYIKKIVKKKLTPRGVPVDVEEGRKIKSEFKSDLFYDDQNKWFKQVRKMLTDKGYDSISYKQTQEDVGSVSYIALKDDIIKSSKEKLKEITKPITKKQIWKLDTEVVEKEKIFDVHGKAGTIMYLNRLIGKEMGNQLYEATVLAQQSLWYNYKTAGLLRGSDVYVITKDGASYKIHAEGTLKTGKPGNEVPTVFFEKLSGPTPTQWTAKELEAVKRGPVKIHEIVKPSKEVTKNKIWKVKSHSDEGTDTGTIEIEKVHPTPIEFDAAFATQQMGLDIKDISSNVREGIPASGFTITKAKSIKEGYKFWYSDDRGIDKAWVTFEKSGYKPKPLNWEYKNPIPVNLDVSSKMIEVDYKTGKMTTIETTAGGRISRYDTKPSALTKKILQDIKDKTSIIEPVKMIPPPELVKQEDDMRIEMATNKDAKSMRRLARKVGLLYKSKNNKQLRGNLDRFFAEYFNIKFKDIKKLTKEQITEARQYMKQLAPDSSGKVKLPRSQEILPLDVFKWSVESFNPLDWLQTARLPLRPIYDVLKPAYINYINGREFKIRELKTIYGNRIKPNSKIDKMLAEFADGQITLQEIPKEYQDIAIARQKFYDKYADELLEKGLIKRSQVFERIKTPPLKEALGTTDTKEAAYRVKWLKSALKKYGVDLRSLLLPHGEWGFKFDMATEKGKWITNMHVGRDDWQTHVLDSIEMMKDFPPQMGEVRRHYYHRIFDQMVDKMYNEGFALEDLWLPGALPKAGPLRARKGATTYKYSALESDAKYIYAVEKYLNLKQANDVALAYADTLKGSRRIMANTYIKYMRGQPTGMDQQIREGLRTISKYTANILDGAGLHGQAKRLRNWTPPAYPIARVASPVARFYYWRYVGLALDTSLKNAIQWQQGMARYGPKHIARAMYEQYTPHAQAIIKESGVLEEGIRRGGHFIAEASTQQKLNKIEDASYAMWNITDTFNRQVVGLAAYNLAMEQGMSHLQAIDAMRNGSHETQYGYTKADSLLLDMTSPAFRFILFKKWPLAKVEMIRQWAKDGQHEAIFNLAMQEFMIFKAAQKVGVDLGPMFSSIWNLATRGMDSPAKMFPLADELVTIYKAFGNGPEADKARGRLIRAWEGLGNRYVGKIIEAGKAWANNWEVRDYKGQLQYKTTPYEQAVRLFSVPLASTKRRKEIQLMVKLGNDVLAYKEKITREYLAGNADKAAKLQREMMGKYADDFIDYYGKELQLVDIGDIRRYVKKRESSTTERIRRTLPGKGVRLPIGAEYPHKKRQPKNLLERVRGY